MELLRRLIAEWRLRNVDPIERVESQADEGDVEAARYLISQFGYAVLDGCRTSAKALNDIGQERSATEMWKAGTDLLNILATIHGEGFTSLYSSDDLSFR